MDDISVYDAIGNSLDDINQRFQKFDIRLSLYDQQQVGLDAFFTSVQQNSAAFNNFYTQVSENSAFYKGASNLVYSLQDYWQNPVTLVYPKTFAVLAGYKDIENWLNTDFYDFGPNQMVRVNFFIKSYDDQLLSGTALEKFTNETLDALASPYGLKTADIKRFIVLDNHVNAVIATTNNIISRIDKSLVAKTHLDINILINSFTIKRQTISSSKINAPTETLLLIWSFLQQYQIIRDEYQALFDLQISSLPSNVITKFNDKNIFNTVIGSFCFIKTGDWKYVPSCQRDICINSYCDDCYDPIDVNKLYNGTDCSLVAKYVLYECEDATKEPTIHIFNESTTFSIPDGAEYVDIHAWGARGGDDSSGIGPNFLKIKIYGGGGSYAYGRYNVIEGQSLKVICNEFGGAPYNIPNVYCPAGGGLGGVFLNANEVIKTSYNRALVIAAGGGGAVSIYNANATANYADNGFAADSPGTSGESANMKGVDTFPLFITSTREVGGGGGGYRGGGRLLPAPGMNGSAPGMGGTSFISSIMDNSIITPGSGRFTANTTSDMALLLDDVNNKGGVVLKVYYKTNYILS